MKDQLLTVLCLIVAATLVFGCSDKKNPTGPDDDGNGGTNNTVKTGDRTQVASQSVGSGGATVTIQKSGDPLDGMEIEIPSGAFTESRTIVVSEAAVTSHSLGANVTALSPLITVRNVAGYADEPVTMKIPVTVPDGHLAMGVLYDDATGKIEGMPIVDITTTSVTVALRTFVPSQIGASTAKSAFKLFGGEETAAEGDILVLSVPEAVLTASPVISTQYAPGVDDWEFINRGSFIEPNGICAGQSISAMWYFYEKKLRGAPSLYHLYDRVQTSREVLWQDNPRGYRFASTVQKDLDWDSLSRKIFLTMRETPEYHHLSWKCFALSMYLTGDPQYVGLLSNEGGHAIVAYKLDYANGILYVADPNYPGQERTITYNGVQFDPYNTKQNANEPDEHAYTGIGYFAKSSMVDWDKIASRWTELENATIGNDRFPQYRLWVSDGATGHELAPSEVVNADSIVVQVQWKNGLVDNTIFLTVYYGDGTKLAPDPPYEFSAKALTIRLNPGENVLGFHIWGKVNNDYSWLDFQWVPVVYSSLAIEPATLAGPKDAEVTFTAVMEGNPPDNAKYLWDFGDGTPDVSILNDPEVTHTYTAEGAYTVTLSLYDAGATPEKLMGTAEAGATIGGYLGRLQNVIMSLPGGSTMYGLDISAGWDDSVALVTDAITLYVHPRFKPSGSVLVSGDIPVDYKVYVDDVEVKSGVIVLEPYNGREYADGSADVGIGTLAEGRHIIRLVLDPDMKITDPADSNRDVNRIIDHSINVAKSYF